LISAVAKPGVLAPTTTSDFNYVNIDTTIARYQSVSATVPVVMAGGAPSNTIVFAYRRAPESGGDATDDKIMTAVANSLDYTGYSLSTVTNANENFNTTSIATVSTDRKKVGIVFPNANNIIFYAEAAGIDIGSPYNWGAVTNFYTDTGTIQYPSLVNTLGAQGVVYRNDTSVGNDASGRAKFAARVRTVVLNYTAIQDTSS
jgi:hypothetical protein